MSGYVVAVAPCACCKVPFAFNPLSVPSTTAGEKEPVCLLCMGMVNAKREAQGLAPFPIAADAYEPIEVARI